MEENQFMDWLNTGNNIAMDWYQLTHPATYPSAGVRVTSSGVQASGSVVFLLVALAAVFLLRD